MATQDLIPLHAPAFGWQTDEVKETKRRPYHHGDLRAALLSAAEQELEKGGSEHISLRELSRAVGVSNTAPRRHFSNRQALLDALAIVGFERLGKCLDRAITGSGAAFSERLIKLAHAHIRFARRHPALLRLMFVAKQHPDASPELIAASYKALNAGPQTIRGGQIEGAVIEGDPERLALTVFAAVEGLLALSVNGQLGGVAIDWLIVGLVGQIIEGLRPRASPSRKKSKTQQVSVVPT